MKFHIIILGCQMNYADSARIKAVLTNCWFTYTDQESEADIVIFDTCSIKQKSEDKITGSLKNILPHQKVWITGCMVQHELKTWEIQNKKTPLKKGNFLEISEKYIPINEDFNPLRSRLRHKQKNVELFRRIDDTGNLPLILKKIGYDVTYDEEVTNEYLKIIPSEFNTSMNNHDKTAYIPISTGCNQFCSYCIVPFARGLEKHFSPEHIIEEAKQHLAKGIKELVLLGQIVNKHPQFVEIIKAILQLEGLERLRYTSPYPNFYTPELLALHESEAKLCPHIHIPFQSGANTILKAMHRGYTVEQAKTFIDNIKGLQRPISITTDIIVGFPGETEEDFQSSLDLIQYGKFDMVYIGIYSPRPGTLAHKNLPDDIDRKIKRDRRNRLNELLKDISLTNNQSEIGHHRPAMIDKITDNEITGYTDNMKQIIITKSDFLPSVGSIINVKITKAIPFKLYWEITTNK